MMRRLTVLLLTQSLCLAFAPVHAAARKAAPEAPAEVVIASDLPADKAAALNGLIEAFNAQEKGGRVVLGESAGAQAVIVGGRAEEALLAQPARVAPLYAVMKGAGLSLEVTRAVPGVTSPAVNDKTGRLLALPVALETPVLFANDAVLKRGGLEGAALPRTWAETQEALGKLADAGVICPLTVARPAQVLIENQSAWHNVPFSSADGTALVANGLGQVRHLARMASWQKSRYLQIYGHGDEAIARFAAGECGYLLAGQAAMAQFVAKDMKVRVGAMPYYDDVAGAPQNSLADGHALWVLSTANAAQKKLIARLVRFWTDPVRQIEWQKASGYLPINRAGAFAALSQTLGPDLVHVGVAIGQLSAKPVTTNSRASAVGHSAAVREILDSELDGVWKDGVAAKLALDNAVARSRGACAACASAAKGKGGR